MRQRRKAVIAGEAVKIGPKSNACICGCGKLVSARATYARSCWIARKRTLRVCACGCGQTVKTMGSKLCRGHYTPEMRQKWSDARRLSNPMKNPETAQKATSKMLKHGQQSKLEAWFESACRFAGLPVWYTGRGDYWVRGRNPDFKVHGQKLVIEVTDGYCRRIERRTLQNYAIPTIEHYGRHAHACLVVKLPVRPRANDYGLRANVVAAVRHFIESGESCVWSVASDKQFIGNAA